MYSKILSGDQKKPSWSGGCRAGSNGATADLRARQRRRHVGVARRGR
jgi:hypothetical protein